MGVSGEALQLHRVYKKPYFFRTGHMKIVLIRFFMCNEIEGPYDKIIITIVPSYTRKYHSFVAVGIVTRVVHL